MTEQVFAIYSRIILQFLLELYVFYVLVMFRYARAKQFAAKLFGGLAAIAVIALGISFIYYYIGGTDAGTAPAGGVWPIPSIPEISAPRPLPNAALFVDMSVLRFYEFLAMISLARLR